MDITPDEIIRVFSPENYAQAQWELQHPLGDPRTISFQGPVYNDVSESEGTFIHHITTKGLLKRGPVLENISLETLSLDPIHPQKSAENLYHISGPVGETYFEEGIFGKKTGAILFFNTADSSIAEQIHISFFNIYRETGSADAAIDWLMHKSPWASSVEFKRLGDESNEK